MKDRKRTPRELILALLIVSVLGIVIYDEKQSEWSEGQDEFELSYGGYSEENAFEVLEHVIYDQERGNMIGYDVLEISKLSEHTFYVRTDLLELELDIKDGYGHTGYRLTEYNSGRELVVSVDY